MKREAVMKASGQKTFMWNAMVPELVVSNLEISLAFWVDLIGFEIMYERVEDHFVYLALDNAQVMLEQAQPEQWITGDMKKPFGRGINFQIEVPSANNILQRLQKQKYSVFVSLEERWYQADDVEHGQLQFLVQDPDGYLLRLVEILGEREIAS